VAEFFCKGIINLHSLERSLEKICDEVGVPLPFGLLHRVMQIAHLPQNTKYDQQKFVKQSVGEILQEVHWEDKSQHKKQQILQKMGTISSQSIFSCAIVQHSIIEN